MAVRRSMAPSWHSNFAQMKRKHVSCIDGWRSRVIV